MGGGADGAGLGGILSETPFAPKQPAQRQRSQSENHRPAPSEAINRLATSARQAIQKAQESQHIELASLNTPEAIQEWLAQNIRLVPYRGSLKGEQGALSEGAANSLDRALLGAKIANSRVSMLGLPAANLTRCKRSNWRSEQPLLFP